MDIFLAIVGIIICSVVILKSGAYLYKKELKKINLFIIGGIAGLLLGFLIYSLVFCFFTTSSIISLYVILFIFIVVGIFLMFVDDNKLEPLASITIGAYMIIRGVSFFLGGFPNETEILTQFSDGKLQISGWIYLYFLLFIFLIYAGCFVQDDNDYIKNFKKQWLEPQEKGKPIVSNNINNFNRVH